MNTRAGKIADAAHAVSEFEGEMRELIRRDVTFLRHPQPSLAPQLDAGGDADNLGALIQRVAGSSSEEIDALIAQLQEMRDVLRNEGERLQREISGYARVGQAARSYTETMSDHLAAWKASVESLRRERD